MMTANFLEFFSNTVKMFEIGGLNEKRKMRHNVVNHQNTDPKSKNSKPSVVKSIFQLFISQCIHGSTHDI